MIKDRDRGFKRRVKQIHDAKNKKPEITVGIHASEGADAHGMTTVLDVAIWNEFGTSRMPARSFIRAWYDENKETLDRLWVTLNRSVIAGIRSKDTAMNLFGQKCVGDIQARMATSIPPPNKDSTVKRKGSSTTLIDTGQLRSSVTYRVPE